MPMGEIAAILFVAGIVLLVAELLLVTHGLMGLLGCLSLLGGVVVCFFIHEWLGIGSLIACVAAAPIVGGWLVKYWPTTRIGRQFVLQPIVRSKDETPPPAQIGDVGTCISEMKPMGMVDFAGQHIEAISDLGYIESGKRVQVTSISNRRPTVRLVP
jgi:membrane-bound serine protease (ClpP class)